MRIAVASQNFRTVTGHAGMARRFIVFFAETGQSPREVTRLDLPKDHSIHEAKAEDSHPLDEVQVLIAGSAGAGFIDRMTQRGVKTVLTSETDPATAVANYLAGTLAAPAPHDHDQGHDHDHDHEQAGGCCCGAGSH
jgi:predicted Fe-Mo cluster-binding NifX family protein